MKRTLHIVNGASMGATLRETGKASDIASWQEALYQGPLAVTDDASFAALRQKYWEEFAGSPPRWTLHTETAARFFPTLNEALPTFAEYDGITLWFEFDLYDQSMLWYILRALKLSGVTLPPLSIVSPDVFPGIEDFRGMGILQADQLNTLFQTAIPVTSAMIESALEHWEAYASNDAEAMRALAGRPSALPYASRALKARLKQIPDPETGFGDIEAFLLRDVEKLGSPKIYTVIGNAIGTYDRDYGLSDFAALEKLFQLAERKPSPIEFVDSAGNRVEFEPENIRETHVRLVSA